MAIPYAITTLLVLSLSAIFHQGYKETIMEYFILAAAGSILVWFLVSRNTFKFDTAYSVGLLSLITVYGLIFWELRDMKDPYFSFENEFLSMHLIAWGAISVGVGMLIKFIRHHVPHQNRTNKI